MSCLPWDGIAPHLRYYDELGINRDSGLEAEDPSTSCRPFQKIEPGFVLGEGAAVLVLESLDRASKAGRPHIRPRWSGYGSTADAEHITKPSVEGQSLAMEAALEEAGMGPDHIDYINAHGTATQVNDAVETLAIKKVFGQRRLRHPHQLDEVHARTSPGRSRGRGACCRGPRAQASDDSADRNTDRARPGVRSRLCAREGQNRSGPENSHVDSFAFGGTNAALIVREHA